MPVLPPRPKSAPLNALRAFESAARLQSFAAASDELCVTPGAITQQIKSLESWAGAKLFDRKAQGVVLTELGHGILAELGKAFDLIGSASTTLRSSANPHIVRIATLPGIAQLWLSPQLPGIRKIFPKLKLYVTAMETVPNLDREPYDLAIFFSKTIDGDDLTYLEKDTLFPVCSPGFLEIMDGDLLKQTDKLLTDATWETDWQIWFEGTQNVKAVTPSGPVYSLYSLALEEVRQGAGLMIGHLPLVRKYLQDGSLVEPFNSRIETGYSLTARISKGCGNPDQICALISILRTGI